MGDYKARWMTADRQGRDRGECFDRTESAQQPHLQETEYCQGKATGQ